MNFLNILVLCGAAMHLASLFLVHKLTREMPGNNLRRGWEILGVLIFFFLFSYLAYVYLLSSKEEGVYTVGLLVPFILFFGAIFVLLVNLLSLKTTLELKRIGTLERENITDPLLDIYNRRYLEHMLHREFLLSRRKELPLSIMLLDIDHFKEVNDTHGHLAGDETLHSLVRVIKGHFRVTDLVARYGGDELLIMLPHTPEAAAWKLAEKLRRAIAAETMVSGGVDEDGKQWPEIKVTVSIGVAGLKPDMASEKDLFAQADQALYRGKETGRNHCMAVADLADEVG